MAKKIFISYKHKDSDVYNDPAFNKYSITEDTDYKITPRHYVNYLEELIIDEHIYKGEKEWESMADFADNTIDTKLKGKIFDSSVTIVLISPNMFIKDIPEKEQWISNEISYSLRNDKKRWDKISKTNAMIAIVLPDFNNSYEYLVTFHSCYFCNTRTRTTSNLFYLLRNNMFNKIDKNFSNCNICAKNEIHQGNDHSFIYPVLFSDFIKDYNKYIDIVVSIRDIHLVDNTHLLKVNHSIE